MIKLPGLTDVHVHMREPGAEHKEDWDTGTAAALAGGITQVLAMPNTQPPITDSETFDSVLDVAQKKARCDYAQYVGAGPVNAEKLAGLAERTAGLKLYLDQTYGPLRLDDMTLWMNHFQHWPRHLPIVAHAESRTLAAVILLASLFDRSVHLAHVSLREEITLVRKAKQRGLKVTCEVAPHHLFLTTEDIPSIGSGRSEVRPRLASATDRDALWENLDIIDCFATDHAPHTLSEKDSDHPPPGFPGLETALPLFLTAIRESRMSIDDLILRMHTNPHRIFNLPDQVDTWIEIDENASWEIDASSMISRCSWTPFQSMKVWGRIRKVVLRGRDAYRDGEILAELGSGMNMRSI